MMKKILNLILVSAVLAFASCEDDDNDKTTAYGEILIGTAAPNPGGATGSTYIQLINSIEAANYDNTKALPYAFGAKPAFYKNHIFELPLMASRVIKKYTCDPNTGLTKTGEMVTDENAAPNLITVLNDQKAYLSLMSRAKIVVFNPTTMTKIKDIDISQYAYKDGVPNSGALLIRDKKLYVGFNQMGPKMVTYDEYKKCDVLIIDTETDKPIKMITESNSGFSTATRPIDPNSIFMDEKKDIYINCLGAFGFIPGHKAGLLRIRSGETKFDPTYKFEVSGTNMEGSEDKPDYIHWLQYAGNGKAYGLVNISKYQSTPFDYLGDKVTLPVEIDIYNKKIKTIGMPRSNSFCSVSKYNEKIVFGLVTDKDSGYYIYDPATKTSSTKAVITTKGYPWIFQHIK